MDLPQTADGPVFSSKTRWVWENPEIGQFYVRVKATRGEETTYSETKSMRTLVAPPSFAMKPIKAERGQLGNIEAGPSVPPPSVVWR